MRVKTFYGYKLIRPDIVVHQRDTDENNLLDIEMKKKDKPDDDIETLMAMVSKSLILSVFEFLKNKRSGALQLGK